MLLPGVVALEACWIIVGAANPSPSLDMMDAVVIPTILPFAATFITTEATEDPYWPAVNPGTDVKLAFNVTGAVPSKLTPDAVISPPEIKKCSLCC